DPGDEVDQPRVVLDRTQVEHGDRPRAAHPLQVVTDEVGDHDVLRVVLRREVRGTGAGALDRPGGDVTVRHREEELGGGGDDPHRPVARPAGHVDHPAARCRVAGREVAGQGGGVGLVVVGGAERGAEHPAQVGLVDVAVAYGRTDPVDGRDVAGLAEGAAPRGGGRAAPAGLAVER